MKIEELKTELRAAHGSAAARRLRSIGQVPVILYGHGQEVEHLSVPQETLRGVLTSGQQLVSLRVGDRQERALLKEVQYDTWGREILHVDFSRVGLDETVTVAVEIVAHGTPKGVLAGCVLEQPLRRVEIACKADAIPENIRVEVAEMDADDRICVKDLALPEGVRVLAEPDAIVFVVKEPREEGAAPAAAAEAGVAEPEVIKRAAKEEAEGEEEKSEKKEKA